MVKIVTNFWENYNANENVIKASVLHITRTMFPNPDPQGESEDMNHVIAELYRLKIFDKWNVERLTSKTRTTQQQFENFLYQRIWAILCNEYDRRRKRSIRFKRMSDAGEYNKDTYKTPDRLYEDEAKINDIKETKREKEEALRHKRASTQPTIYDIGEINSRASLQATDDSLQFNNALNALYSVCNSDNEKNIIKLRMEGLKMNEVGEALNMSGSNVGSLLNKIKTRYQTKLLKTQLT